MEKRLRDSWLAAVCHHIYKQANDVMAQTPEQVWEESIYLNRLALYFRSVEKQH
jgi:hypothetical protein